MSLIHAIDVGTTKIVALTGEVDEERGRVEILAAGEAPSEGLRRGIVVDREAAANSIAEALDACDMDYGPVTVGIAGSHISSRNTEITLLNRSRNLTVGERFLRRLDWEARQTEINPDEQVLHVIPRGYVLDGSEGVKQPLGLAARKVTMRAHTVSGAVSSIQNLLRAVEDCGMTVSEMVLEQLASAESCLTEEDRKAGVALIDIGGGTTDLAVFINGVLVHTAVFPLGGESFSADIAYGLKLPFTAGEQLKVRYGTVLSDLVDPVAAVKLGDRHYSASFVSQILEYRGQELMEYVRDSLEDARVRNLLPGGAVLTGGGSLLDGVPELAEDMLGLRTKIATPWGVVNEDNRFQEPQYATAVGLLLFSSNRDESEVKDKGASVTSFGSIVRAIKSWFRGV